MNGVVNYVSAQVTSRSTGHSSAETGSTGASASEAVTSVTSISIPAVASVETKAITSVTTAARTATATEARSTAAPASAEALGTDFGKVGVVFFFLFTFSKGFLRHVADLHFFNCIQKRWVLLSGLIPVVKDGVLHEQSHFILLFLIKG